MEDNILEVKNLTKYFPVQGGSLRVQNRYVKAVDDVSPKARDSLISTYVVPLHL